MPAELTFGTVVSLALGSSVVGSLVTQAFTSMRERNSGRREAAYLALRLATIFEKFAEDAAGRIGDMNNYESSGGQIGGYSGEVPTLGQLPDEKERWRELPVQLTTRVLGFTPYRNTVQGFADQTFDVVGAEEGYDEVRSQCAKLGCRALDLAADLRDHYALPELEPGSAWVTFLRSRA